MWYPGTNAPICSKYRIAYLSMCYWSATLLEFTTVSSPRLNKKCSKGRTS